MHDSKSSYGLVSELLKVQNLDKCSSWLRWNSAHSWGQVSSLGLARRPRTP